MEANLPIPVGGRFEYHPSDYNRTLNVCFRVKEWHHALRLLGYNSLPADVKKLMVEVMHQRHLKEFWRYRGAA